MAAMIRTPESVWFWDHYDGAAAQIVDFFAGDGISLAGKQVADIGCRDYDVVVTWSALEHVAEPVSMLREIRRILRPGGVLFLQLWPFYYSDRGSHLWPRFDALSPAPRSQRRADRC